ncbi:MAG TPA: hypothetical protein PK453_08025 [Leptospiraceae bacterium]|nr:hypothetical protein [Leptospiraceae bacterium]HNF13601.1 hypothetical protein [Leptospiraceae bacterium]HNF25262.1 hypothetical protein [Leptospiraceae bacterium]HNO22250.1 hypothetical protein [Leptospiraceae bacterium]
MLFRRGRLATFFTGVTNMVVAEEKTFNTSDLYENMIQQKIENMDTVEKIQLKGILSRLIDSIFEKKEAQKNNK